MATGYRLVEILKDTFPAEGFGNEVKDLEQIHDWLRKHTQQFVFMWKRFRRKKEKREPNYMLICLGILYTYIYLLPVFMKLFRIYILKLA